MVRGTEMSVLYSVAFNRWVLVSCDILRRLKMCRVPQRSDGLPNRPCGTTRATLLVQC